MTARLATPLRRARHLLLLLAAAVLLATVATVGAEPAVDAHVADDEHTAVAEFVATDEWQELLPSQGIPRGLHVRLNLETGKREAKLLDPNEEDTVDDSMRSVVVDPDASVTVATDVANAVVETEEEKDDEQVVEEEVLDESNEEEDTAVLSSEDAEDASEPNWNHEKMVEVLQALPEPPKVEGLDLHDAHEKLSPAEFRRQVIRLWKERQEVLQEAMASLQDDAKYLASLLEKFQDAEQDGDTAGQLSVLEVLEWEVQDLDKTHVFNFIGGFGIMAQYLNDTNLPVRAHASWLVGTAAKNYKEGQEWAIDAGVMPKLLDSLTLAVPSAIERDETSEMTAKDVLEVKKKALYALSSLVRSNERGQRLFLLHSGPEHLADLFTSVHPAKLQLKALLFVYDLLLEVVQEEDAATEPASSLKELQDVFRSPEWCDRFSTFFVANAPQLVEREVIELVDAMRHQLPSCKSAISSAGVQSVVESVAEGFVNNEELEADEKEELTMFFQDFLARL